MFEIVAEVGRGNSGIVYRARHLRILPNRDVALKIPLPVPPADRPKQQARFLREGYALATLYAAAGIPPIYDLGEHQGQRYYTRQYVIGNTFEQLATSQMLGLAQGLDVIAGAARAVQHAHGRGIAHCNLHPANVLVDSATKPWLIGFGRVGRLAGTGNLPPDEVGVPVEVDVRALQEMLRWLGEALSQPLPPRLERMTQPDRVDGPAAFAEALENYLREISPPQETPARPWWRFW
jgi:serine/threonine protein kinase